MNITGNFFIDRRQIVTLIIFVLVNVILFSASIPEGSVKCGADATQYLSPALGLLEYGKLVEVERPDIPVTFGTPMYSFFLAVPLAIFSWQKALAAIVFLQLCLLYWTSLLTSNLVSGVSRHVAFLAQLLVLFNPNSLITAHLIQSETLFTFFLLCVLVFVNKYGTTRHPIYALSAGVFLGVAALTRPVAFYAIFLLPLALILAALRWPLDWKQKYRRQRIFLGLVSAFVALLVTMPWFVRNYRQFGEFFFTSNAGAYLQDQYFQLLEVGNGMSGAESRRNGDLLVEKHADTIGLDLQGTKLHPHAQSLFLFDAYADAFIAQPIEAHLKALSRSWALLFFSGGASNYRNYLGLEGESLHQIFKKEKWTGFIDSISYFISRLKGGYLYLVIGTMSFTLISDFLGLIGMLYLLRDNTLRSQGFIMMGMLTFFTAMYLYLGMPRFRVPLEPVLAICTAFGFYCLRGPRRLRTAP